MQVKYKTTTPGGAFCNVWKRHGVLEISSVSVPCYPLCGLCNSVFSDQSCLLLFQRLLHDFVLFVKLYLFHLVLELRWFIFLFFLFVFWFFVLFFSNTERKARVCDGFVDETYLLARWKLLKVCVLPPPLLSLFLRSFRSPTSLPSIPPFRHQN